MGKTAFLFPGQGSQYVGMGKSICEKYKVAKNTFEEASDVLGFDLKGLCMEGDMEELTRTENTQPAILTASVAAFRVYMEEIGHGPECLAGHSLGEISALCCAGAINFTDAVKIVRQRGKFMQEAASMGLGSMAAVSGVAQSVVEEECKRISTIGRIVVVSNYNSPEQIVISGHSDGVNTVAGKLGEMGARIVPLKVSAPFHSPLMQQASDRLKEELSKYTFHDLVWPVISNVNALPYKNKDNITEILSLQVVQPVHWQRSMEYLKEQGIVTGVEMGPQTVLKNLMKKNAPGIKVYSYDSDEEMASIRRELSRDGQVGLDGMEKGMDVIIKCIATAVCTKNSNWDNNEYQKGVIEPYRRIQKMKEELNKDGTKPTIGQVKDALDMLRSVLTTKKIPIEEQFEIFEEIFKETGTHCIFQDFKITG